jgi:serine/threonine protein kinase
LAEFKHALAQYLQGQLSLRSLEAALLASLQEDPESGQQSLQMLDQLFRSSRLPAQVYISLKKHIPDPSSRAPAVEMPAPSQEPDPQLITRREQVPPVASTPTIVEPTSDVPEPPPETPTRPPESAPESPPQIPATAPSEPEQGHSDILDILQSGDASVPTPPEPLADLPGVAAPPSDDKTVFRQSAPPTSPTGQSSVPHTGTGPAAYTGRSGPTGPTGGISRPTGTGSNWTDPSKWGDAPTRPMEVGSVLKDRYVLESVIGRGGMGVVFKARDLRREEAQDRNPYIAVKILNDEFRRHPESLKALQRESRKAQDLAHPNIVTVFDFDRDGAIVYMTMEYLEGYSLDKCFKDPSFDGMPLSEAYPLIAGLGSALSYAHDKGIVHSDFKPGNTFLTNEGEIKVFDFGIARAAKLPGDKSGEMTLFDPGSLGALTPAYASREMIEGEEPDPRDDIYALACVAYELLTGRHPFDKRPASEAYDKGLVPAPIKGISRRNWRGMQRGLAFNRGDRSTNVQELVDDLRIRRLSKTSIAVAAAASLALVAFSFFVVSSIVPEWRINKLISGITESDDTEIPQILQELFELEAAEQDTVYGNSRVKDRLIEYFITEIEASQNALDYPRAEALITEAQTLYDDSNKLAIAREALDRDKADLLAELDNRFGASLQAGRILPTDQEGIVAVLEVYSKIDPNNPALTDPRLAFAYADAGEQALADDVLRAGLYIEEGLRRFPGDPRLVGLRDRFNTVREVQDKELRIAELEQRLSAALASIVEPSGFRSIANDFLQLEALDPSNATVAELSSRLESLLNSTVDTALARNDWIAARSAIEENKPLLSATFRTAAEGRIDTAESAYNDRVGGALADVNEAAQRGDLARAETLLAQLQQLNVAESNVKQARDTISRAYLDAARAERASGRFDEARGKVQGGRAVDPEFSDWDRELELIAEAEQLQAAGLEEKERQALEQQRQERIARIEESIQNALRQSPFTVQSARSTLNLIDELAGENPSTDLLREGRSEVASKLASEARVLGIQNQDFDGALKLVDQGIELLPAQRSLRDMRSQLQTERDTYMARMAAEQANELKAEFDRLLRAPTYDTDWDTNLRRVVQRLEPLAANAGYLSGKREEVAELYLDKAKSLRAEERLGLAEDMLDRLRWFVGDYAPASKERELLAIAQREFDAANQVRELSAKIDGLKRTFATELNAERIQDARRALTALRGLLPSGDVFITSEAPQAIADTYSRMAQRALAESRFDRAEQLAEAGLKEVQNHEGLNELLANIRPMRLERNVAQLKNAIQTAPPTDSAGPKALLAKVKNDAGAQYSDIEAEIKALADARVEEAKQDRAAVVAWVAMIFDSYTAPSRAGPPCTASLAGYGSRGSRAQCFDYLPGSTTAGPRLVVVPPGNGIPRSFAIARQEISVGQWNEYCRLSGNCSARTGENDSWPITNIRVEDVQAYAKWLSDGTNHTYRLPTFAEWEHAANATGPEKMSPNCVNPQAGLLGDELFEVNRGGQNGWGIMNFLR